MKIKIKIKMSFAGGFPMQIKSMMYPDVYLTNPKYINKTEIDIDSITKKNIKKEEIKNIYYDKNYNYNYNYNDYGLFYDNYNKINIINDDKILIKNKKKIYKYFLIYKLLCYKCFIGEYNDNNTIIYDKNNFISYNLKYNIEI